MDNQNNQNNQVPQEGYTNFNNYQPPVDPNAQQPIPQGQPVPQGQPMQYQVPVAAQKKDNSTTMGVIAIVTGLLGLIACGFPLGGASIACAIAGLTKKKNSVVCWVGLVIGIITIIATIATMAYQAAHPELQEQALDNLKQILESTEAIVIR